MKNYKMIIISLLLLIFMVGAVSAADENATDDLEITDEISVDDEVVASSDVNEVESDDVLEVAEDDDNLGNQLIPSIPINPFDPISPVDPSNSSRVEAEDNMAVVYGEDAEFKATFLYPDDVPVANEYVGFEVVDSETDDVVKTVETTTDENGIAGFKIDLPIGIYDVMCIHPDDFALNCVYTMAVLEEAINTTIIANDVTVLYGDKNEYVIKEIDYFGQPLIGYTISWELEDEDGKSTFGEGISDENGVVSFIIDLQVGIHTIFLINEETGEELSYTITVLEPKPTIVPDNATLSYDANSKFSVNFTDRFGNALNNTVVYFMIGNDAINTTTDENGVASFDLNDLGLGKFNITIINPVTNQMVNKSISLTTNETVFAGDASAVYNEGSKFTANFTDKYGKALANATVTFAIDGQEINATTDENGVASFDIEFDVGIHNVTITNPATGEKVNTTLSVAKNENTNATNNAEPEKAADAGTKTTETASSAKKVKPKLTAKNKVTFKAKKKVKKFSITLKSGKKALKKVKVTLKIKGKTYKAKTNAKGKATFKITKLTKKGKYSAKIKFAGNKNFKAVTKSVKIIVK